MNGQGPCRFGAALRDLAARVTVEAIRANMTRRQSGRKQSGWQMSDQPYGQVQNQGA